MPDSTEGETGNPPSPRVLPDPAICHTRPIGEIRSFATCLVKCPSTCPHVMSYGSSYLCRHPDWEQFLKL